MRGLAILAPYRFCLPPFCCGGITQLLSFMGIQNSSDFCVQGTIPNTQTQQTNVGGDNRTQQPACRNSTFILPLFTFTRPAPGTGQAQARLLPRYPHVYHYSHSSVLCHAASLRKPGRPASRAAANDHRLPSAGLPHGWRGRATSSCEYTFHLFPQRCCLVLVSSNHTS